MEYFDFHVHPSLKGSLSRNRRSYNAWNEFKIYKVASGVLKKFLQILNSQATLDQIKKRSVLSVVALIGMETAFANNFVIQKILASRIVSPLSRKLLRKVAKGKTTYFAMLQRDLNQLLLSQKIDPFNIICNFKKIKPSEVNVVLSVEGSHSFQDKTDEEDEAERGKSILYNFREFKKVE